MQRDLLSSSLHSLLSMVYCKRYVLILRFPLAAEKFITEAISFTCSIPQMIVLYDVIKNNVMQIRSHRSKFLKCYRRWHCLLLYQILCHSDWRFLRYKFLKSGDFHICCMAKWPGGHKLYSNMASTI